jgi:DNA processing protein
LIYKIAVTLIDDVGSISAKKLIAYCGGEEAIFRESKKALEKIPGIGQKVIETIISKKALERAEKEVKFIEKNNIKLLWYLNEDYPYRLKHCIDSPIVIYSKGNAELNKSKVISIVGTRNISSYGKKICKDLIDELSKQDILVVSGLAYGVDVCAHKNAIKNGLTNVAVLGNSLDRIYPALHREVASDIIMEVC